MASQAPDRPQGRAPGRPLSPHLQIWRWGPHMLVSILHRVLGVGVAVVGLPLFVWWLAATAAGDESYRYWADWFTYHDGRLNIIGWVFAVGLSWSIFQHMMTGLRHFVLDTGAGYELRRNKAGAMATMGASVLLTVLFWAYMLGVK